MDGSGADRAQGGEVDAAGAARASGGRRRRTTRRRSWIAAAGLLVAAAVGTGMTPAGAQTLEKGRATPSRSVTWTGNGVEDDGGAAPSLDHEVCGIDNGAPVEGTYLQWVLVAKDADSATLTIGTDAPVTMTRQGRRGTFQYVQTDAGTLQDVIDGGVTASYVGKADPKAKVVLGSGCLDVTLTAVSAVPFGIISLGLTEAQCLATTTNGTAAPVYEPATVDFPSACVVFERDAPATTYTVVMAINPAIAHLLPEAGISLNAALVTPTGRYVSNPACSDSGVFDYCLVTASTTVTIQAPPPV